eukprot:gene24303-31099_t
MNGDGVRDQTGWVSASDGLLAIDRNGDGQITNGSEISFTADLAGASSDLEGLRAYDTNGNGILDKGDSGWSNFLVWQDKNQDGISQSDELVRLDDLGIASIGLTRDLSGQSVVSGENYVSATSTLVYDDGSTASVGDVALAFTSAQTSSVASLAGGE